MTGESIGHWEGDTLVVDTIGLNGKIWLDRVGHPDSDQMHITERIRRTDEKPCKSISLLTIPSPTHAVDSTMRFGLHPTWDIMEDICEDNRAFDSFEK